MSAASDLEQRRGDCPLPFIARVLRCPDIVTGLTLADWDVLVRQARAAGLLGHLQARLEAEGLLSSVPERPQVHLQSTRILADRQRGSVQWEVDRVCVALSHLDIPVVLLKGAAYAVADLPPAPGRLFNDIDIMVPKTALADTESALLDAGWMTTHLDAYDQRYYRRWMHDLPPMQHIHQQTTLDIHHTILP